MINGYFVEDDRLFRAAAPVESAERIIWYDLHNPMPKDRAAIERVTGIRVPTREEMEEIEESSRLFTEDGAIYMTVVLPARVDERNAEMAPLSFVLTDRWLITVHDHEPRGFQTFANRAERTPLGCVDGESVLMALLDAIVDRLADILEKTASDTKQLSRRVLRKQERGEPPMDYEGVLRDIGHHGEIVSNVLDSLVTLERMLVYMGPATSQWPLSKDSRARIKSLARDTQYLSEHSAFMTQKIQFLLDATLGMINIEQNATIKIFSVAAVVFLPPTLIASIYGMNFDIMPELQWAFGYPFALGLMVGSAVLSFGVFKKYGWL